jgi:hypothetical protein
MMNDFHRKAYRGKSLTPDPVSGRAWGLLPPFKPGFPDPPGQPGGSGLNA